MLAATGLYRETAEGWCFVSPTLDADDPDNLAPTWRAATELLKENAHRTVPVAEIYDVWRQAPLGIKDGLLPVLAVAFLLSQRGTLAFYRQGIFQAHVSDLDIDYLARDPADAQLRWMDLSDMSRRLLSEMADIVRDLDEENILCHLEPIDVARGLVAIHDQLSPWVGRTQRLSRNAKQIRQLFKQANDPNKLIFDDIPKVLNDVQGIDDREDIQQIAGRVREGLTELRQAYPTMLNRMRETLLAELQVPNASPSMLAELRARADNMSASLEAIIAWRLSSFALLGSREATRTWRDWRVWLSTSPLGIGLIQTLIVQRLNSPTWPNSLCVRRLLPASKAAKTKGTPWP